MKKSQLNESKIDFDFLPKSSFCGPQIDVPKLIDIFASEYPREKTEYDKILERDLIRRAEWLKSQGYNN